MAGHRADAQEHLKTCEYSERLTMRAVITWHFALSNVLQA
jgi:hypothetical protein